LRDNSFVGWSGFGLFVLAIAILVLLVFQPVLERYNIINVEAGTFVAGVLSVIGTIVGFVAFKTAQGKVAAIGGLVLVVILAIVLPHSMQQRSIPIEEHSERLAP
jgi:hypothetical protein